MRSPKYYTVKEYYDKELWSKARVRNAVTKGWITEEEYDMIINGEPEAEDHAEPEAEDAAETE